ncbi:MAG: sulfatase-like hydrolase/transferase [Clostridia bacterium]|nr:sulfatase-like hydrolase/transferase [Clostridia bacterium]
MKKEEVKEETLDKKEEVEQNENVQEEKLSMRDKVLLLIKHLLVFVIFAMVSYISIHALKESNMFRYNFTEQRVNALELGIFTLLFMFYTNFNSKGKFDIFHKIKIIVPIIGAFLIGYFNRDYIYTTAILAEVLLLNLTTEIYSRKFPKLAYILNSIFSVLIMIQIGVKFFGGTYISVIMLSNLDSIRDIGGNAIKYILAIIGVLVVSFLPLKKSTKSLKIELLMLIETIIYTVFLTINIKYVFYTIYNYKLVYEDMQNYMNEVHSLETLKVEPSEFYHNEVKDYIAKPDNLPDKPNVIYVFTEGLSNYVVQYEDLMPTVKDLKCKGITFNNYFNHTFATYRAIIGQLYSGYQYHNYDANPLISMQSLLSEKGYQSAFINVEPDNKEFTRYLKALKFDKYYDMKEYKNSTEGFVKGHLSDKLAYEELYNKAIELNNEGKPFVLGIYTLGTHVTFDGIYHKDYDNAVHNKFNDLDYALKEFLEKFENGPLFDNTIFVFTADHATYEDIDYKVAFPNSNRALAVIDTMPLVIYHKGIEHQELDAKGRNTLDFAPTVLDYIDESGPNYFLGESLFSGEDGGTFLDRSFFDGGTVIQSDKNGILEIHKSGDVYDTGKRYIALVLTKNKLKESIQEDLIDNSVKRTTSENKIENLVKNLIEE